MHYYHKAVKRVWRWWFLSHQQNSLNDINSCKISCICIVIHGHRQNLISCCQSHVPPLQKVHQIHRQLFWVILLIDRQIHKGKNITFLPILGGRTVMKFIMSLGVSFCDVADQVENSQTYGLAKRWRQFLLLPPAAPWTLLRTLVNDQALSCLVNFLLALTCLS